ncbi:uncharacterized protein [Ranitomeya imitator]|uniref:uncharacterized protein n=1 Tax=Ranitomeya imitator TaxID=111125 RepID=UPI0037E752E6
MVSAEGVAPNPDKVNVIRDWPKPSTIHEVRQFLGLVGYYRRFIKDLTKIAAPLQDLLGGQSKKTKNKSPQFAWNNGLEESFIRLKLAVTGDEVLAYPDYDQLFLLYTVASNVGLGDWEQCCPRCIKAERVIAYASRKLCFTERNLL